MQTIKINEAQPLPCKKCGEKMGYQYSDYMALHYTSFHSPFGEYEGGAYSDGCNLINKAVSAFCVNCGERLPFKLERKTVEDVSKNTIL